MVVVRLLGVLALLALGGCGAYADVLEPPGDPDVNLVLSQSYGVRGTSFQMDLWFAELEALDKQCWPSLLNFEAGTGSGGVGSTQTTKLDGCVGVRATVIVAADAEIGSRKVHLRFHRPTAEGVLDGVAEFDVVEQAPQGNGDGP